MNTSHESCSRTNDLLYSPNMPILRRHSRVSEGSAFTDIPATNSSLYRNALYHSGTGYYSVHQQVWHSFFLRRYTVYLAVGTRNSLQFPKKQLLTFKLSWALLTVRWTSCPEIVWAFGSHKLNWPIKPFWGLCPYRFEWVVYSPSGKD